ncbi:hypothetical protein RCL1_001184 [Eukaryota sp. TZLM3-RCL]
MPDILTTLSQLNSDLDKLQQSLKTSCRTPLTTIDLNLKDLLPTQSPPPPPVSVSLSLESLINTDTKDDNRLSLQSDIPALLKKRISSTPSMDRVLKVCDTPQKSYTPIRTRPIHPPSFSVSDYIERKASITDPLNDTMFYESSNDSTSVSSNTITPKLRSCPSPLPLKRSTVKIRKLSTTPKSFGPRGWIY